MIIFAATQSYCLDKRLIISDHLGNRPYVSQSVDIDLLSLSYHWFKLFVLFSHSRKCTWFIFVFHAEILTRLRPITLYFFWKPNETNSIGRFCDVFTSIIAKFQVSIIVSIAVYSLFEFYMIIFRCPAESFTRPTAEDFFLFRKVKQGQAIGKGFSPLVVLSFIRILSHCFSHFGL